MRRFSVFFVVLGAFLVFLLLGEPARAQATRTWVSGVGDDANPCSRTAPCKTFAGAISKTATAGEINCLDPGGFGALTILKSITLDCTGTLGSVLSTVDGIIINGSGVVVTIRNLAINGVGAGTRGIRYLQGSALHVENVRIQRFTQAGIFFGPSIGSPNQLVVKNTIISEVIGTGSAGILIQPTGSATVNGDIDGVTMANANIGLFVNGSASSANRVSVALHDSSVTDNGNTGLWVKSASATVRVVVDRSTIANNGYGTYSEGSGADITLSSSVVTGNGTGIASSAPGTIRSYGNNQLQGNVSVNGTPSSTINLQ